MPIHLPCSGGFPSATQRFLSLLLTVCSLSLLVALLPIFVALPQALAQTIEDRRGEAARLFQQAQEQRQTSQFQAALQSLQQALEIYRDVGDRMSEERILNNIGDIYLYLGQYPQALESLQQALAIAQLLNDRRGEAPILGNIGSVYSYLGQYPQALDYFQRALSLAREVGDRVGEGVTFNNIGNVYLNQGQYAQALEAFQKALSISQEVNNRAGEGAILNNIGLVYTYVGRYPQATEYLQQSLSIRREVGDREGEGDTLNNIGTIYGDLGQYAQAIESYQQALTITREVGDRAGEGVATSNIGGVYAKQGLYPQALEFHQQALSIAREVGARAEEGGILGNIGRVYGAQGEYTRALEFYRQALSIAREVGNREGEGTILNNIGGVYADFGQYSKALEHHHQSLFIAQEIGDRAGEGTALSNIGGVYAIQGQYSQAMESHQQALSIAREVGDRAGEGSILAGIGAVYFSLGQFPKALEACQQALFIAQEIGDQVGESAILNNIGDVYAIQGQYSQAMEFYQQALTITREVGDREGEGSALTSIGMAYIGLEQYPQAMELLQQALSIAQEIGTRVGEGSILAGIGAVSNSLKQYPQAIGFLQQALSIAQEVGVPAGEGGILASIGAIHFKSGQLQSAETALSDALTRLEELRQQDLSDTDRISLFDTQFNVYQLLQQVQIAQNQIELALETSERGRGRAFVSLLSQVLQQEADSTPNRLTPSISNIQQTAREQNATLVQYSVINTSVGTPAIYIWVIAPTGEIAFRSVELNEENQQALSGAIDTAFAGNPVFRGNSTTISNLVSNVRPTDRSVNRDIEFEYNPNLARNSLHQLHQLLIEPIADLLPRNPTDRIIFIPQGGLFLVPFAALQDANGDYLIEKHTVSIAPSIQILDLTQQQANPDRSLDNALIVGNPSMPTIWDAQSNTNIPLSPLPGAEQEAEAIAQFLNTNAITGEAATETVIAQQMPEADIIHFATHGLLEYGNPADSGVLDVPGAIALTRSNQDDGLLTSAEILEMQLQAELVVLSACDTGRGRITGDGVVGLSRALMSAGVPSVVVSLWSVPDAPTAELMSEFYRQLQTTSDKAQALRQAMLITMQQHPDPIDWAAFTLIGEVE